MDLADKLNPGMVERLNAAITGDKAALEGKDTSGIKTETEKLQKVLSEAGSAGTRRPPGSRRTAGRGTAFAGCWWFGQCRWPRR